MDKNQKTSFGARLRALLFRAWHGILHLSCRIRDRKTHVFRRCPVCKKLLRLPRTEGEHGVNCPSCRAHFSLKTK